VSAGPARQPHPDPLAEQLFKDLELHGWRITWDDTNQHFRVACPHDARFVYAWPVALAYRWLWHDHFRRLTDGHREECPA
jgi:hypothetical protein